MFVCFYFYAATLHIGTKIIIAAYRVFGFIACRCTICFPCIDKYFTSPFVFHQYLSSSAGFRCCGFSCNGGGGWSLTEFWRREAVESERHIIAGAAEFIVRLRHCVRASLYESNRGGPRQLQLAACIASVKHELRDRRKSLKIICPNTRMVNLSFPVEECGTQQNVLLRTRFHIRTTVMLL